MVDYNKHKRIKELRTKVIENRKHTSEELKKNRELRELVYGRNTK